ncbi:hypothetical protein GP486_007120 [Trichoglossum hirsutum]|uniref:Uncharacterized protein n=1 Tax=Trichoglossum hirsutum TaxID=265104 RepID=A0A9P8IJP7_9PEZI|nr:hypothetical protein GP486_007120 [Trichoglossum hirsutum]
MSESSIDWRSLEPGEVRIIVEQQVALIGSINHPQTAYVRSAIIAWMSQGDRLETLASYIFTSLRLEDQADDNIPPRSNSGGPTLVSGDTDDHLMSDAPNDKVGYVRQLLFQAGVHQAGRVRVRQLPPRPPCQTRRYRVERQSPVRQLPPRLSCQALKRTAATSPSTATKAAVPSKEASKKTKRTSSSIATKAVVPNKGRSSKTAAIPNKGESSKTAAAGQSAAGVAEFSDPENPQDIRKLNKKWGDLEKADLASTNLWLRANWQGKAKPNHLKRLSVFAELSITKRVKNKMVSVIIGPGLADKMLSIAGEDALNELASQIQITMRKEKDHANTTVGTNVMFDDRCYDNGSEVYSNFGMIVSLGQENIKIDLDYSLTRLKYRYNCIWIKKYYELERASEVAATKKDKGKGKQGTATQAKNEEGKQGEGVATRAKDSICELLHCTASRFDAWVRLGAQLCLLIEEMGDRVLALIPLEISDSKILQIPVAAFKLVVSTLPEWRPGIKKLSGLVDIFLLHALLKGGLITPMIIKDMLLKANGPALKHAVKILAGPLLETIEAHIAAEGEENSEEIVVGTVWNAHGAAIRGIGNRVDAHRSIVAMPPPPPKGYIGRRSFPPL